MGCGLPFELVAQIAEHRRDDPQRFLTQYALVGRTWQAAFEAFIYDRILYCIILPWDLPDYERIIDSTPEETYSPDNFIQRANNEAFTAATLKLFGLLSGIDTDRRVIISIETLGREKGYEPGTAPWNRSGKARGKGAAWPYRAEFSSKSVPLPRAECVDRIIADNRCFYRGNSKNIRLEAACWIAHACPTLTHWELEADDTALPEHLDYAQHRRSAVAEALLHLSATLRTLHLRALTVDPLHESLPAPVLCSKEHDLLTTNIRNLSLSLRELHLDDIQIRRPDFLPSGEWLKDPGPIVTEDFEFGDIDDPDFDYADAVERAKGPDPIRGGHIYWDRDVVNRELYLLNCISTGYAARRMPRLQHMEVAFNSGLTWSTYMVFNKEQKAGNATVAWNGDGYNNYKPDDRVAQAWGFALNRLVRNHQPRANDITEDQVSDSVTVSWNSWR
ncbi:hypothetical protein BDW74DRAFT_171145 [Aspergillus multicolor]|uniref:uncharacterized protein n=1 Tax=Aspergillus multicolor TaxID=41759 RepID=UPI003CCE3A21